jgi:hypothetical protein
MDIAILFNACVTLFFFISTNTQDHQLMKSFRFQFSINWPHGFEAYGEEVHCDMENW